MATDTWYAVATLPEKQKVKVCITVNGKPVEWDAFAANQATAFEPDPFPRPIALGKIRTVELTYPNKVKEMYPGDQCTWTIGDIDGDGLLHICLDIVGNPEWTQF